MRAYNMGMATIFINAGIYIVGLMGMFGNIGNDSFMSVFNTFATPIITVAGVPIRGIDAIAIALAVATIVVLNSNAINDRGIAYTVFAIMFWGSFGLASVSLSSIDLPGIEIMYSIFFLAAVLIFVMAFVQMPTGGQKSHV